MGNLFSKPTEHVFYGEIPITFSSNLLSTLQSSTESDSTRKKLQDIEIQKLVQNELERLQKREDEVLTQLAQETPADTQGSTVSSILSAIPFVGSKDNGTDELGLSSQKLKERVEELRNRLGTQIKIEEESGEVKKARDDLVRCLRIYDRRPLECWKEVKAFREVGRLRAKEFVDTVLRER